MGKRKDVVDTLRRQKAKNDLSDLSDNSGDRGEALPKEDHLNLEEFDAGANARDIDDYLETSEIPYRCSSPTCGDGNCWLRSSGDRCVKMSKDARRSGRRTS